MRVVYVEIRAGDVIDSGDDSHRVECASREGAERLGVERARIDVCAGGRVHRIILADANPQSTVTPGTNSLEAADPPSMASAAMMTAAAVYAVRSPLGNRSIVGYTMPVQ